MALGNNSFNSGPLIFITSRSRDEKGNKIKPFFSVSRVDESNKIAQTNEQVTSISGDLIKMEYKERDVKTKAGTTEKRKSAVLYINDAAASETYHIDIGFTLAGRSLFNALASLVDSGSFSELELSIYENRKGYESYGLKQAGQQVKWKYSLDELPKADPITDKKGNLIKNDYSEVDEFFLTEINKISEKLGSKKKDSQPAQENSSAKTQGGKVPSNKTTPAPTKNTPASNECTDEDLPF